MSYKIESIDLAKHFPLLLELPDKPKGLRAAGTLPPETHTLLAVVGSRRYSEYGKSACERLIAGLEGFPLSIVSGLALGIDSIAHRAALRHKLHTIAVPGSGLSPQVLYPRNHQGLAEEIIEAGGALVSEFEDDFKATPWSFPQRNRIMAGMSKAILVIEAEEKSGTLITSRLATDYNREVLTVPGSIFSPQSAGPHMLIRLGATPIRNSDDILEALGIGHAKKEVTRYEAENHEEEVVLALLETPRSRDELIRESALPASAVNGILAILEIKGVIEESMGEIRIIN